MRPEFRRFTIFHAREVTTLPGSAPSASTLRRRPLTRYAMTSDYTGHATRASLFKLASSLVDALRDERDASAVDFLVPLARLIIIVA